MRMVYNTNIILLIILIYFFPSFRKMDRSDDNRGAKIRRAKEECELLRCAVISGMHTRPFAKSYRDVVTPGPRSFCTPFR